MTGTPIQPVAGGHRGAVLVAEDDADVRDALAEALRAEGYAVVPVADGTAAIGAVRAREFDVVVTDVQMPGADGIAVLRATKDATPDTEVVVTTAYASVNVAVACLRAGAADLVQKPTPLEAVLAIVARAAARRRLYAASQALLATREAAELPRVVVEAALSVLDADAASLMLPGGDGRLHIAYAHGVPDDVQSRVRVAFGDRIAGRVAQQQSPALIRSAPADDPRFAGVEGHGRAGSSIVYPLVADERRLVGVLNVSRAGRDGQEPFGREDVRRAGVLVSQALLALDNARLVRERLALERLASMGQLAAALSHEINNPLTYVLASLDYARGVLRAASSDDGAATTAAAAREAAQAVDDAHDGAARIRDIVRDVVALARTDGRAAAPFDVNEAVRTAVRMASAEVTGRAEVELRCGADTAVVGSPGPLSQVFTNLLVNAAHAVAERPDGPRRVVVTSRREGAAVIIDVADTGPGIAPENVPRLFEPFFTTKRGGHGTGLGLSISREIVRRHDGEIRVSSTPGQGATFTVELPAAEARARISARAGEGAATAARDGARDGARGRVLVVDDEPAILRIFERLWGHDHEVVVARGGTEALEALAARPDVDLVVCDVLMPDVNGIEVFRRASAAHPEVADAFVFMTGCRDQDEVRAFAASVPNPVLEKPLRLDQLHALLRDRVARRRPSLA